MGHHHHHDEIESKNRLLATMLLNFLISVSELLGGILSGSLSLISDALHNFSDGIAIIISYIAMKIARIPKNEKYTFGFKRAEIFAAIINTSVLIIISFFLIKESIDKFIHPQAITGNIMVVVASIGLIANVIGTFLLKKDASDSMNIRSAYLHLLSDALSSIGVIIGGVLIWVWNIYWVDPILTVLISLYILYESYEIMKNAVDIFMMKSPTDFSTQEIVDSINTIDNVDGVHHIHYWMLNEKETHFEAHIETENIDMNHIDKIRNEINELLEHKFSINHITLQFEYVNCEN